MRGAGKAIRQGRAKPVSNKHGPKAKRSVNRVVWIERRTATFDRSTHLSGMLANVVHKPVSRAKSAVAALKPKRCEMEGALLLADRRDCNHTTR